MSGHLFFYRHDGALKKLAIDEIIIIEAANNYVKIHKRGGILMLRTTLDAALNRLPEKQFLRVHRSFAVSVDYIDMISKKAVFMKDMEPGVPVSRQHYPEMIKQIIILDGESPEPKKSK
ncbi:MAG TPA: hypothetical protein DIC22_10065 [Chitinophagaceae bacterium]|jgi:DNA-binding LytR/AlgR family response regulator|nr:hypothetical protein [Chitinophagaceae bacterium]